jgi:mannose-6-phosphate isomerase-like protein (cupin superfamily)
VARQVEKRYGVSPLSEIQPLASDLVEGEWRPVRYHFGITAFGCNAYVARAEGELIVEEHSETGHEELYVVLAGEARFTLDGDDVSAPAGTLVHCPPPVVRKAVAAAPGTTVLAVGAIPGQAFRVSGWESRRTPR